MAASWQVTQQFGVILAPDAVPTRGPYRPCLVDMRGFAPFPNDWALYCSTDHDVGSGGIYLFVADGDPTNPANWSAHPGNPIFIDSTEGTQTETPWVIIEGATVYLTYHNHNSGGTNRQSSQLATSSDGITFSRVDLGGGTNVILTYSTAEEIGNAHSGYMVWAPSTNFPKIKKPYFGFARHGGGNWGHFQQCGADTIQQVWETVQRLSFVRGAPGKDGPIWWDYADPRAFRLASNGDIIALFTAGQWQDRPRLAGMYEVRLSPDGTELTSVPELVLDGDAVEGVEEFTYVDWDGRYIFFYTGAVGTQAGGTNTIYAMEMTFSESPATPYIHRYRDSACGTLDGITDRAATTVPSPAGSLSVGGWVYLDNDVTSVAVLVGIQDGGAAGGRLLRFRGDQVVNRIEFTAFPDSGLTTLAVAFDALAVKRWHHVIGVIDAVANELRLYVNGVLADSLDTTGQTWNDLISREPRRFWHIGARSDTMTNLLAARVADISVYDTALTVAQVQDIRTNGYHGSSAGNFVERWPIDDAAGLVLAGDNGSDATLTVSSEANFWSNEFDYPQESQRDVFDADSLPALPSDWQSVESDGPSTTVLSGGLIRLQPSGIGQAVQFESLQTIVPNLYEMIELYVTGWRLSALNFAQITPLHLIFGSAELADAGGATSDTLSIFVDDTSNVDGTARLKITKQAVETNRDWVDYVLGVAGPAGTRANESRSRRAFGLRWWPHQNKIALLAENWCEHRILTLTPGEIDLDQPMKPAIYAANDELVIERIEFTATLNGAPPQPSTEDPLMFQVF